MLRETSRIEKIKEVNRNLTLKTKDGKYSESFKNRSCLTVCWNSSGFKTAVAIGINPSKANDEKSDKTLTTLARFLDAYGYCELKMLNIFESYSTDQRKLNKDTKTDFSKYTELLNKADGIIIVWGLGNCHKSYKKEILRILQKYPNKLFCIKNERDKFPIHPSRMGYNAALIRCEISEKTPNGGAYSEIIYLDSQNNIVSAANATQCVIRECEVDGTLISETIGTVKRNN